MPVIEVDGVGNIEVGEEFLTMTPEQQGAEIDNIVANEKPSFRQVPVSDQTGLFSDDPLRGVGELVPGGPTVDPEGGFLGLGFDFALPGIIEEPRRAVMDLLMGRRTAEEITGKEVFGIGALATPGSVAAGTGIPAARAAGLGRRRSAGQGQPAAPSPTPLQVAEAAERQGVSVPRAAASDSTSVQQLGKIATNVPIGGTPLRKAAQTSIEELGQVAASVQSKFGAGSPGFAGARFRAGLETQITKNTAARVKAKYDAVDELVDASIKTPLRSTERMSERIAAERAESGIPAASPAVQVVKEAIERPEGLTYNGLKNLRTFVGQMIDNPSILPSNIPKAELKRLYGALTDDLRFAVARSGIGPEGSKTALRAFDRANKFAAAIATRNKRLADILKPKADEGIFEKLIASASSKSRADAKLLAQARASVGRETWNEIASAAVARLGRDADGNFSPDRFIGPNGWGRLSERGKRVLFGTTGRRDLVRSLDDIATISRRFKELQQFANPSGTGQTIIGAGFGGSLPASFFDPTAGLITIGTVIGTRALANVMAKPATVKTMARWARAREVALKAPSRASYAAARRANHVLAFRIAEDLGSPAVAARIAEGLENPGQSSAQPNPEEQP